MPPLANEISVSEQCTAQVDVPFEVHFAIDFGDNIDLSNGVEQRRIFSSLHN